MEPVADGPPQALPERLGALGARLGAREAEQRSALEEARRVAETLHGRVGEALDAFHGAVEAAGSPQLRVALSDVRPDEKHLRSIQFDVRRGRYVALVTVKSRGDVTLVGPFRAGKVEGPCQSFPFGAEELDGALGAFLEEFLEEAATP